MWKLLLLLPSSQSKVCMARHKPGSRPVIPSATPFSACVIDGTTEVGHDLAKVFVAFLRQELGEDSFKVERLPPRQSEPRVSTPCAH
jgi:hypothetical protein